MATLLPYNFTGLPLLKYSVLLFKSAMISTFYCLEKLFQLRSGGV
jgi:hypothetical protein